MNPEKSQNVYETPPYGESFTYQEGYKFEIFTSSEETFSIPLVTKDLGNGYLSAESPYGYSGIKINPNVSQSAQKAEWINFLGELQQKGLVHLKIKFPPYIPSQARSLSNFPNVQVVEVGRTILVPKLLPEQNWDLLEGRSRTSIRKARNNGLTAEISEFTGSDTCSNSEFRTLYETTMSRKDAASFYFFDDSYFKKLQRDLNKAVFKIIVRNSDGQSLAGCLVLKDQRFAHYHLSGSSPEGTRVGANNLMLWTLIEHVSDTSLQGTHIGGGLKFEDSLYMFKKSFGGNSVPFEIGAVVTDKPFVQEAATRRAKELGITLAELLNVGYFPAFETPSHFVSHSAT